MPLVTPTITALLMHHKADEMTLRTHRRLLDQNTLRDGVRVVPICFPEYRKQALPGTYVAENLSKFRWNRNVKFHRFSHQRKPILSDLDCLMWDYVMHGGIPTDRIILCEGDMLAKCSLRDFFLPSFMFDVSGSVPRIGLNPNKKWPWYRCCSRQTLSHLAEHVASLTPVCGIQLKWKTCLDISKLIYENPGKFDDMHVEMAIPSLARYLGFTIGETIVPDGLKAHTFINYLPHLIQLREWGVFHPVK